MPDNDHKPNRQATLAGAVAIVLLLIAGVWVFNRLDASQKAQNCMESGGRRCAGIDTDSLKKP